MMRHNLNSTLFIYDEWTGNDSSYSRGDKADALIPYVGSIFVGGALSSMMIGFPLQAIFADLNHGTPMHWTFWISPFLPFIVLSIWWVIMPRFHYKWGMTYAQRRAFNVYHRMPEQAKKELPPAEEIRKAILEADSMETSELEQKFTNLSQQTRRAQQAEAALTPEVKSARVEALMAMLDDSKSSMEVYTEKMREFSE
jgi:hypothetical protein